MINELLEIKNKLDGFDWGGKDNWYSDAAKQEILEVNMYERFFTVNEGDVVVDLGASLGPFTYPMPIANSNPSISGSGGYNSYIYYGSGSYTYGTVQSTKLMVSTTTSFSSASSSKTGIDSFAKKIYNEIPNAISKKIGRAASGYIPNFADALKSAISREIGAGANPNDIYIDQNLQANLFSHL